MNTISERDQLLTQVREADTLEQVEQAIEALRCWVRHHPEDIGIRDAFEPLSHRKDFLLSETLAEPPIAAR